MYTIGTARKGVDAGTYCVHNRRVPPRIKRRKPVRKEQTIHLRVTAEQKETLAAEAERVGLALSSWMLMLALREVEANKKTPPTK